MKSIVLASSALLFGALALPAFAQDTARPEAMYAPVRAVALSAPPARHGKHPSAHAYEASAYHHAAGGSTVSASFYGGGPRKYEPNTHTANGERFNQWAMTAAHRSLPFGTRLRVSYAGRSIVVRINDRGPATWTGRSLDLSRGAAHALGMPGVARVQIARL